MQLLCPHCRSPVELASLPRGEEISCPSCGSSFHLEGETTGPFNPRTGQSFGKFELIETVGQGAFGTVYKARDRELDRIVAIKVPRATQLPGSQELDRFVREARSVAQLRHPSIVPIYEVGQSEETPFLVSQFVEGFTLADLLTDRRPGAADAAKLVAAVADALHYAHGRGVVHRDVKPSNIMIGADGGPFVMDFGLAKRDAGEVTMTVEGQVLGTPAYMSPEQARGEAHGVDGRSDVYSLGVVLYQLLTGELPFRGNARMLLHHVLHDEPRPLRSLNDHVPRDLETVCLKAMTKEPGRRYATAGEFADDLRRFLAGEPIKARPVGRLERAWVWTKRRPAAAGLLVASVVAALALVGVGVGAVFYGRLREANQRAADALEKADQSLYYLQIDQADRSWWANDVGRAREILAEVPAQRRRWEWNYLDRLCRFGSTVLVAGVAEFACVAYSPDGRFLAAGSVDGFVRVWDAGSGRQVAKLKANPVAVFSVAFSPDGKLLACTGGRAGQGELKAWNVSPELGGAGLLFKEAFTAAGVAGERAPLAFSADSARLAVGSGVTENQPVQVVIFSVTNGQELLRIATPNELGLLTVAFSPDGKRLATGSGSFYQPRPSGVHIWDASSGKPLHSLGGEQQWVNSVVFSPDGKLLAAAGEDKKVRLWDAASYREFQTLRGHAAGVVQVTFRPDGRRLASASDDGSVKVWDVGSGDEALTLRGHAGMVLAVAYSPDGRRLATAGTDSAVRQWDAEAPQESRVLSGHDKAVQSVAFCPTGRRLASASLDGTVRLWDLPSGRSSRVLGQLGQPGYAVAFSSDGRLIAAGGGDWGNEAERGRVSVWEVASGRLLHRLDAHPRIVWSLAFSRGGTRLVTGGGENFTPGGMKVWDAASGRVLLDLPRPFGVSSVASAPDGRSFAGVAWKEKLLRVYDLDTGEERFHCSQAKFSPNSLAYSPDGRWLVSGGTGEAAQQVWDAGTGNPVRTLRGHAGSTQGLSFSPDGQRLAAGAMSRLVKLWDVTTGQDVLTLRGHTAMVLAVAFSPDGQWLATGAEDNSVRLWDARPAEGESWP